MKKILFIHHAKGWGGAPISMINIINGLDRSKYLIKVLLIKDSIVGQKLKENNISYSIAQGLFFKYLYNIYGHTVPGHIKWYDIFRQSYRAIIWIFSRYYFIPKEIKKHDLDIVHLNSSTLTDWLAPCKKKGAVIMHIREPLTKGRFGFRNRFFAFQMRRYSDKLIAISKDNAERINLPNKTSIVYNFSDLSYCKPNESSYLNKTVLYVGGYSHIKGFSTLVDALQFIENDVKIIFAGNYPPINKTKMIRIMHSPIEFIKSIIFKKHKTNKIALNKMRSSSKAIEVGLIYNISFLLNKACCLVSPFSVTHFSRPVIEAFANYKPAIVSDVEGMSEIVKNNSNGLIVKKNNPEELAEAINYICNNEKIATVMGENGYKDAIEKFSVLNIHKIEAIYDELL